MLFRVHPVSLSFAGNAQSRRKEFAAGPPSGWKSAGCRADPILVLSNGAVLDLELEIAAPLKSVGRIGFTLYGPKDTSLVKVVFPDGTSEVTDIRYIPGQPTDVYVGYATVTTEQPHVPLSAYLSVVQLPLDEDPLQQAASPTQGASGQELVVTLKPGRGADRRC